MPRPTELTTARVQDLYREHAHDLKRVRSSMSDLWRRRGRGWADVPFLWRLARFLPGPRMRSMLDDESAEITYLLVRDRKPTNVVEISPCDGWSTHWILHALADNGQPARLTSYDLHDGARRNVTAVPQCVDWELKVGDVHELPIPDGIDFLYIDSDHRAAFAHWYLEEILPKVLAGAPICIDDIYHAAEPRDLDGDFGESRVIHDWLLERGVSFSTASTHKAPEAFDRINATKKTLGLTGRVRPSTTNATVFFFADGDDRVAG